MTDRPLIAIGGFAVDGDTLRDLENALDAHCQQAGFPTRCEFKWSPPVGNWMRTNLIENARRDFFINVLHEAHAHGVTAVVVIEDEMNNTAQQGLTHERDVLELFLERVSNFLGRHGSTGFVIADQPGGGPGEEHKFLLNCLEARERGTAYVEHTDLALSVVCAKSNFVRCLQLADLIVSATLARVAGNPYAVPIFEEIRPLLDRDGVRIGGYGLKIHPDMRYANLYHWLLGDTHWWRANAGYPFPQTTMLYSHSEND